MFDGDPSSPGAALAMDYDRCFAFENFDLVMNPLRYEYSSIDITEQRVRRVKEDQDYFELFDFSAKYDSSNDSLFKITPPWLKGFTVKPQPMI